MKHLVRNPVLLVLSLVGLGLSHCADPSGSAGAGGAISIEARGAGRVWTFSYPGPDGELGTKDDLRSQDEVRVPVGAEIDLQLRSEDFIYVFSCPDLGLKEIAVPDLKFALAFTVNHLGKFHLAMDPMCGFQLPPGKTMGRLVSSSDRDFRQWLKSL